MKEILKDINSVVGVAGSFVCNSEGELIANVIDELEVNTISIAGKRMILTLKSMKSVGKEVNEIDLLYAGGRVLIKTVKGGALFIVCNRNMNLPLLNLMADIAVKRLSAMMVGDKKSTVTTRGLSLVVKLHNGQGAKKGLVSVDEDLAKQWTRGVGNELSIKVKSSNRSHIFRVSPRKSLGGTILMTSTDAEEFAVRNGDTVVVTSVPLGNIGNI